jgi:hypothetical protein
MEVTIKTAAIFCLGFMNRKIVVRDSPVLQSIRRSWSPRKRSQEVGFYDLSLHKIYQSILHCRLRYSQFKDIKRSYSKLDWLLVKINKQKGKWEQCGTFNATLMCGLIFHFYFINLQTN